MQRLSNGVIYLELDGRESRFDLGFQHGTALREEICRSIDYVKDWYRSELGAE